MNLLYCWSSGGAGYARESAIHTEPLPRFARRVHAEFTRLLRELGPRGYQQAWGMHGFPQRPFDELGRLLAQRA